ncbi:hypothetical protein [Novipirellula artificiosorum]|uniref:Uncharacterized protein n=1 Tax=Novipirellula artificiosorum TaxID=2528016 RepID=A0A5C6DMS1_9BACT|nr:hypothetical protein [Novipirellula artificiosorum]TWU38603.1 hypothetical protein Poly41_30800 [Novipirellula artificiosorum]
MRILFASILTCSAVAMVNADVSTVQFDKTTQRERAGDRFVVSVVEKYGNTIITVSIAKRIDERFVGANLHVYDQRIQRDTKRKQIGRIPVAATAGSHGEDQQVSLYMSRELATKCRLGISIGDESPDAKQSKTYYLIDVGSYFPDH